jgi:phytoene dehydrogenase-like protein
MITVNGQPDAVVVGAGPNGLAAALRLAAAGLRVQVVERSDQPGGGVRSDALTLPGFLHDLCSAAHPMAAASPFFREFDLAGRDVRLLFPEIPYAHPLDGGGAAVALRSVEETAARFGVDAGPYRRLMGAVLEHGQDVVDYFLASSFRRPPTRGLGSLAFFGANGLLSVRRLTRTWFDTDGPRALLAGAASHSMMPLTKTITGGFGLLQGMLAHLTGWPVVQGGSQRLADAMITALEQQGGEVVCGHEVTDLREFDGVPAVLLDVSPRDFVRMAGDRLPEGYRRWVRRYRYGPGVVKVDWALSDPVPWENEDVRRAGTVHVGGTLEEMVAAEAAPPRGRVAEKPFVLTVQPTVVDPTRAPVGRHVLWGYAHVPHGSDVDVTDRIETQIERFAPGFRDTVLARHTYTAREMEAHNPNDVGGEISSGMPSLRQMLARPVPRWNTYKTPIDGVFLASAATPPGPAVHGMCGDNAARTALREVFGVRAKPRLRPPLG